MKKLFAFVLTLLCASPLLAQSVYTNSLAATSTPAAVTFGGQAVALLAFNDGPNAAFVDYSGAAALASGSTTAIKLSACEGRRFVFAANGPAGLSYVTAASTATVRVEAYFGSSLSPSGPADFSTFLSSTACTATTFSTLTISGALVLQSTLQGNFNTFALTSGAAAATFVKVAVPTNSGVNLLVEYVFEASVVTPNVQSFGGMIGINAVNVGGTITCTVGVPTTATQPALAAGSGTLTNAITCADGTGGVLNILATDTSSITPTTNRIRYRIHGLAGTTLVATAQ